MDELTKFYQLIKSQKEPLFYKEYNDILHKFQQQLATLLNLKNAQGALVSDLSKVYIHTQKPPADQRGIADKERGNGMDKYGRPKVGNRSVSSGSLWDFICTGISDSVIGDSPDARTFRQNTWLTVPGKHERVAGEEIILHLLEQIRKFDIGSKLRQWGQEYTGEVAKRSRTGIWGSLPEYTKSNFEIALYDAMRKGHITRKFFESLIHINKSVVPASASVVNWHQFYIVERVSQPLNAIDELLEDALTFPMDYIDCAEGQAREDQIAGWLFQIPDQTGDVYCSYIPGRTGKEFVMHTSRKEAEVTLTDEANNEIGKKTISRHWIYNAMPLEIVHDLRMVFDKPEVNESDLIPFANFLYSSFGGKKILYLL